MGLRVYANKEREILILLTLVHYVCLTPVDQTHRSYTSKTILMPDLQIRTIRSSTHERKFNSVSQKYSKKRFMLTWCPNCIATLNSFGSAQRKLGRFQHRFGSPRKIIRNVWKSLGHYGNPSYDKTKISHILTKKKLAGILILWSNIPESSKEFYCFTH